MVEQQASLLVTDDREAYTTALSLGLPVTRTLRVLEMAAERELLDLPTTVHQLREAGFSTPTDVVAAMPPAKRQAVLRRPRGQLLLEAWASSAIESRLAPRSRVLLSSVPCPIYINEGAVRTLSNNVRARVHHDRDCSHGLFDTKSWGKGPHGLVTIYRSFVLRL